MDAARQLFDQIVAGGSRLLAAWVEEHYPESEILDFKVTTTTDGAIQEDDKKNLAMALSGFGNSRGGVVVWGVDARKGRDSIDAAQTSRPIPGLQRFISDLRSHTPQLVAPGLKETEHKPIKARRTDDTGYAITYVPAGQEGLQMAMASKQQRYYHRIGDTFLPMPEYMVAAGYHHRRPHPRLELTGRLQFFENHLRYGRNVLFHLWICNRGAGIARYPALAVYENETFKLGPFGVGEKPAFPQRAGIDEGGRRTHMFCGGANDVLYPGTSMWITHGHLPPALSIGLGSPSLPVEYVLYCDGFVFPGVFEVQASSLIEAIQSPSAIVQLGTFAVEE